MTPAQDLPLTLEGALANARPSLRKKILYSIDLIRKAEPMALRLDPVDGFYNTFSGGKDSQCLYHLVKLAGVKAKTHMNLTSVDPPEVIRFVKTQYPDVELIKPKMSIYDMAKKKHILPDRIRRWCCKVFKEMGGAGKVTLIGIRKDESARRAKRKEISTKIKGKRKEETFDQWSEHEEKMVTCVGGKDKILVSPIIHWTERDVWEFLNSNGIPHCELYDKGYSRIGCICCPMSQHRQKRKEIERWPHVKRNWIKTIQWLKDNGYNFHAEESAETNFRWWISGKSFAQFYADEFQQQKINFEETIEQAADVYADKAPESYCNGYYGKYAIADAFEEGARWRIESVWHDVSEIPDNVPTLVEYPHTDGRYGYATTNEPVQLLGSITRWAYLSDLLPDRKEDDL